jgi:hypothetical protein
LEAAPIGQRRRHARHRIANGVVYMSSEERNQSPIVDRLSLDEPALRLCGGDRLPKLVRDQSFM